MCPLRTVYWRAVQGWADKAWCVFYVLCVLVCCTRVDCQRLVCLVRTVCILDISTTHIFETKTYFDLAKNILLSSEGTPRDNRTREIETGIISFLFLTEYCAGGKIEKNEMGRACGAYGGGERGAQGSGGET